MPPRSSNGRLTAELRLELLGLFKREPGVRRWLEGEVARRYRARLEAIAALERELNCVVCGNAFESESPEARTCSSPCRQRAYRERLRARVQAPEAVAA